MTEWAELIIKHMGIVIELLAALIIGIGLVKFVIRYVANLVKGGVERNNKHLRIRFGIALTLALELLLAADILQTAMAPTWDDIGKLGAIAVIRTVLNYFLEQENNKIPVAASLPEENTP
jgi:uncharacterized membrane protein